MNLEQKLLELDRLEGILDFRFKNGCSIYLAARAILRIQLQYTHNESQGKSSSEKSPVSDKSAFHSYLKNVYANRPKAKKVEVLSIANYEGNPDQPNQMTAFLREPEVKLSHTELLYSTKLKTFAGIKNAFSLDYFYYKASLLSKLKNMLVKSRASEVQDCVRALEKGLGEAWAVADRRSMTSQLLHADSLSILYSKYIKRYFKECNPKLVVCSEGNTGDFKYLFIFKALNELNIPSSEVQHGALGYSMRFDELLIKNSLFYQQKSKYLFTFGEFHNSQSNAAKINVPLGLYRMDKLGKRHEQAIKAGETFNIALITEGIPYTSQNNQLTETVKEALKEIITPYNLTVRLHYTEKPGERYDILKEAKNFEYSQSKDEDIYETIAKNDIIIGHTSTVLFEALYFKKKVLVLDDGTTEAVIPKKLGNWFKDSKELKTLIESKSEDHAIDASHFWKEGGFTSNFLEFLQDMVSSS